jgi:hypothetical protein
MANKLFDLKNGVENIHLKSGYGGLYGLKCNGPANIEEIFKSGKTPKLSYEM